MSNFAPHSRVSSTHRLSLVLGGGFTALTTVLVRFGNYAGTPDTLMPFLPLTFAVAFLLMDASRDANPDEEPADGPRVSDAAEQEAQPV